LNGKSVSKHTLLGIPVSGFDVLGGSEVNGNGFDQSFNFQDFVSKFERK
jgi:hypothetical protein